MLKHDTGRRYLELDGRVAMVVGTSPNIGAGIALGLADAGALVACVDASQSNAADCASEIARAGGRSMASCCDATDETAVQRVVESVSDKFGIVDVLVNAATRYDEEGLMSMPLDRWRRQVDVVLTGMFLMTKHVVLDLVRGGRPGTIVNISSTAGHQGEPNNIGYSTAKAGVLNFTRSAAMELAAHGIRVNSLTPTSTDPREALEREREWGRPPRDEDEVAEMLKFFGGIARRVPLGVLPSPSDYADAVVFLASERARMITGIDLRVDAGTVAKYWRWEPGEDQRPPSL